MSHIAVIGSGSWGTALAKVLADNGLRVTLAGRNEQVVRQINQTHMNERYLPGASLPTEIQATVDVQSTVSCHQDVVLALPSHALATTAARIGPHLHPDARLLHVIKGIDPNTLLRPSEQLSHQLPERFHDRIACLSGPSHAEEVVLGCPTTVVISGPSQSIAEHFQTLFMNPTFRVYVNPDMIGVELGGALKNIIALGAGISDGLGYGDNARAALMTRGLVEIARLGVHLGASQATFAGLAGIGDLIVTCTSQLSRNWRAGNLLGKGIPLDEVLASMNMVVEGIRTTDAACRLAARHGVDMPITRAIQGVLNGDLSPRQAVESLMGRERTHEIEESVERVPVSWKLP